MVRSSAPRALRRLLQPGRCITCVPSPAPDSTSPAHPPQARAALSAAAAALVLGAASAGGFVDGPRFAAADAAARRAQADKTVRTLVPAGGACDADNACEPGDSCYLSAGVYPGTCYPDGLGPSNSAGCTGWGSLDDCRRGFCACATDDAFLCNEHYACVMAVGGKRCSRNTQCASNACVDGYCDDTLLPEGFPCAVDGECSSGTCTKGECTLLDGGAACVTDASCLSGACTDGACEYLPSATGTPSATTSMSATPSDSGTPTGTPPSTGTRTAKRSRSAPRSRSSTRSNSAERTSTRSHTSKRTSTRSSSRSRTESPPRSRSPPAHRSRTKAPKGGAAVVGGGLEMPPPPSPQRQRAGTAASEEGSAPPPQEDGGGPLGSATRTPSYTPRGTRYYNPGCGHGGKCYRDSPSPSRNRNLQREQMAAERKRRRRSD